MKRTVWADKRVESMVNAGFIPILIDVGDPQCIFGSTFARPENKTV